MLCIEYPIFGVGVCHKLLDSEFGAGVQNQQGFGGEGCKIIRNLRVGDASQLTLELSQLGTNPFGFNSTLSKLRVNSTGSQLSSFCAVWTSKGGVFPRLNWSQLNPTSSASQLNLESSQLGGYSRVNLSLIQFISIQNGERHLLKEENNSTNALNLQYSFHILVL